MNFAFKLWNFTDAYFYFVNNVKMLLIWNYTGFVFVKILLNLQLIYTKKVIECETVVEKEKKKLCVDASR